MIDFGPRRSGRTTRIVDECIQEFFRDGYVACYDHYGSRAMNEMVQKRVCARLYSEHRLRDFKHFRENGVYMVALNECVDEAKEVARLMKRDAV